MNIGRLDRRVTIEKVVKVRDAYGQVSENWGVFKEVWASVTWQRAGEKLEQGRETSATKALFYIRYMEGITSEMRLSFQSKKWNILDVSYKDRNGSIEILAEKK